MKTNCVAIASLFRPLFDGQLCVEMPRVFQNNHAESFGLCMRRQEFVSVPRVTQISHLSADILPPTDKLLFDLSK